MFIKQLRSWLSLGSSEKNAQGLLLQEAEIESLQKTTKSDEAQCEQVKHKGESKKAQLEQFEQERQVLRDQLREYGQSLQAKRSEYAAIEAKSAEWITRREQLSIELTELTEELKSNELSLEESTEKLALATAGAEEFDRQRVNLQNEKEVVQSALAQARQAEQQARELMQVQQAEQSNLVNQRTSLEQGIGRMQSQLEAQSERLLELQTLLAVEDPVEVMSETLSELLEKRILVERDLSSARALLGEHENSMRDIDQQRSSSSSKFR